MFTPPSASALLGTTIYAQQRPGSAASLFEQHYVGFRNNSAFSTKQMNTHEYHAKRIAR